MRPEIHRLTEAVRAMQIAPTGQAAPNCVRIGLAKDKLPEAMLELRLALDALDAAGAAALDQGGEEAAKLRQAIDGLLRYIKMRGLELDDAEDIVRSSLGKSKKRRKRLEPLPVFAPNGFKRKKKFKPGLKVEHDSVTRGAVEADLNKMSWVIDELGPAAVQRPHPDSRRAASTGS